MQGVTMTDFYLDTANGRGVTSDDPPFSVSFGGRSKVTYRDDHGEIWLGADLEGAIYRIGTNALRNQVALIPQPARDARVALILDRIRAAAAWRDQSVVFIGMWGDEARAQAANPPEVYPQ